MISFQFLLHLERRVAVGKVVDDCQRLLEPGTSNPCVCDQLTHCLDDLRWRDDREDAGLENKKKKKDGTGLVGLTDLQMRAHYRFPLGELEILSHEKIKQSRRFRLGAAGTMVAALEDFVTQTTAQIGFTLEEGAGELQA